MWKIVLGFAVFAALALFILMKSGGNVDMGGEKHDLGAAPEPAVAAAVGAASAAASSALAASQ